MPVWLAAASPRGAQNYDLLLKGGHVIDAKNGIDDVRDVAVAGGKIAAVAGLRVETGRFGFVDMYGRKAGWRPEADL